KGGKATGVSREVELAEQIRALRAEMFTAAENLDFERAAKMRDELKKMEALAGKDGGDVTAFYDPYGDAPKKKAGRGGGGMRVTEPAGGGKKKQSMSSKKATARSRGWKR